MIDKTIKKKAMQLMNTGLIISLLGLLGIIVFALTGWYIINPTIYIIMSIMGMGWLLTGSTMLWESFK